MAESPSSDREKYREKWFQYNLRSRYFNEDTTPRDVSKLPRLKRPRTSRASGRGESSTGHASASAGSGSAPGPPSSKPTRGSAGPDEAHVYQSNVHVREIPSQCSYGEVPVLEAAEVYCQLLLESNSISPCDEHFTKFLLNCFNHENHSLESNKYIMVSRRAICFSGTWQWVYCYSCDAARSQVLHSVAEHVRQRTDDLPGCLHTDCLASILVNFDESIGITANQLNQDHSYAHVPGLEEDLDIPHNLDNIWPLCSNARGVVIVNEQMFAVVDISSNKLRCSACKHSSCPHIKQVQDAWEKSDLPVFLAEMADIFASAEGRRRPQFDGSCTSWKAIPFHIGDIPLHEVLRKPVKERVSFANDRLQLIPPANGNCGCCDSAWSYATYVRGQFPVFTLKGVHQATVFFRKCSNELCDTELQYDGLSDCLLNMTTYLIDHCVLRQYMYQFLYGRSPMFGFYCVWMQMQHDAGNCSFASKLHYKKFVFGWYNFLWLLDIPYQEQFLCGKDQCGRNPEIIICDATHLAFRKDLSLWKENAPKTTKGVQPSPTRNSVFLPNIETRKLLKKYCRSSEAHPFPPEDFLALTELCRQHQQSLVPLLTQLGNSGQASAPPGVYKPLLLALSATSPVCGLIHPEPDLLNLLGKMSQGFSPRKDLHTMALLTDKCPIVADLLSSEKILPDALLPVFVEVLRLSLAPFQQSGSTFAESTTTDQGKFGCDHPPSDNFDGVAFWPHFPQQRSRPKYAMDGLKSSRASCRKDSKNYGRMTPGVFAAFCPHGICYGFEVMNQFESPNVPFTLLLTRFETPPKIVVYDNACHLHTYCLNREPGMFRNTKFFIDRLHWPNHTACSVGYKLDGYSKYKRINSQVAEQMNSSLNRIKVQLSYMRQDNFLTHCRFYLWGKNIKKQGAYGR